MRYVQGSETVGELTSEAIGGPVKAPIPYAGPPVHAVPVGTTSGVCGQECPHVFDDDPWERGFGGSDHWCPECVKLAPRDG
ncbi:MAG TPA: hypothetical protein VM142_12470 [Acidimicrobiales bacterium]|nr:hypothetical protein [Acidimicrobiales bacterium]